MPEDVLTPDQKAVRKLTPNDKPAPDAAQRKQRRLDMMKQRTVLSDCVVMLRYALDESCRLPTTLIDDIAKIDAILVAAGDEPLSERPESLIKRKPELPKTSAEGANQVAGAPEPQPIASQAQTGGAQTPAEPAAKQPAESSKPAPETQSTPSIDQLLLNVHNALSDLVAPATALSLRETDPDLFWFGMPRIVQWAIYGACFFLLWFLFAVANSVKKQDEKTPEQTAKTTASASPSPTQATPSPSPRNP